jgi:hypothetical protein
VEVIGAGVTGAASSFGLLFVWSWISKIPGVANLTQRIHKFVFKIPTDSERIETIELQNREIVEGLKAVIESIVDENDENNDDEPATSVVSVSDLLLHE